MNDQRIIAVTGATGNISSRLTELLLGRGLAVRAIARGGERLAALAARGAEPRTGSLEDTAFLAAALAGAEAVFAMVPPHPTAPDLRAFQRSVGEAEAAAIATAGVRRVVALSSIGAQHDGGTGPIAGLHDLEQTLRAVPGVEVTALRAAYFMENFLHNLGLIRSAGINGSAVAPDVAVPTVATRDLADVAAALLAADAGGGAIRYALGSRDLTFAEATRILGAAIGKADLPYVQFSYEDTLQALLAAGLSPSVAAAYVEMQRAINDGLLRPTEPRSAESTTPTTLEEWSQTFAAAYAGGA